VRPAVVSSPLCAFILLLLLLECFDDLVQLGEPCVPQLVVRVDPRSDLVEPARADTARIVGESPSRAIVSLSSAIT